MLACVMCLSTRVLAQGPAPTVRVTLDEAIALASARNPDARLVHFTIGGPYFEEYRGCDYAEEWFEENRRMNYAENRVPA